MAAMMRVAPVSSQYNLPICLLPNDLFDFSDSTNSALSWLPDVSNLLSVFEAGPTNWPVGGPESQSSHIQLTQQPRGSGSENLLNKQVDFGIEKTSNATGTVMEDVKEEDSIMKKISPPDNNPEQQTQNG